MKNGKAYLMLNLSLADLMDKLSIVNNKIWHLEADIRDGKENELGWEEVGRRAVQVRDLNRERIAIKNEINRRFDKDNYFKEIKINHQSE